MVTDFYEPLVGGVEIAVRRAAHELVRRGHDVAVATLAAGGHGPGTALDGEVRVHRITTTAQRSARLFATARPWAPPAPDPEAVAGLRSIVAREAPDVVHGHDWLARSYLPLKRRGGAPLVMALHYFTLSCPKKTLMHDGVACSGPALAKCLACAGRHYGREKGSLVVLAHRASAPLERARVDLFLPVSEATADGNGLRKAGLPYVVVPNIVTPPPDPAPHARLLAELPPEPFLLFVGDLRPEKGIAVLLDAYARLREAPPLVLIGKVLREPVGALPAGATLHRDWPNGAVRHAMARSLALVAPSVWPEPFGVVVAEALAAGRPVIASRIGGMQEIVRDGREGLLVPPGDVPALAAALQRLAGDADLGRALASNALRRSEDYTSAAVLPILEGAYARVAGARSP